MPRVAIITGASQGLGLALAKSLYAEGWGIVIDARNATRLDAAVVEITGHGGQGQGHTVQGRTSAALVALAGDITDRAHRDAIIERAHALGPVQLIVNNASTLGASPLPALDELRDETLRRVLEVNVIAPLALVQMLASDLQPGATIVNITSDAAVEPYPGWGAYGAAKAALEHAGRILAAEHPEWRVLIVDPGDMRTEMHQDAFPGEDISDRPPPEDSVPGLMALIAGNQSSGRYHAREVSR
ncbi:MAG: SDR family oxidoreductase [Acidimicrobiales bacterium]